jgi:hypothetical protein
MMQQMYSPMAQAVQSRGRGEDTMLVHMTPTEVNSLQGLALANGGSLTINPDTGLPEAGFLGKILPTLIGGLATVATGGALSPLLIAGLTGAGTAAVTGDISKGLMAGLGAFGGAGIANALGAGAASTAAGTATQAAQGAVPELTMDAANMGLANAGVPEVANTALQVAEPTARYAAQAGAETFSQAFNPEFMASLNAPAQAATAPLISSRKYPVVCLAWVRELLSRVLLVSLVVSVKLYAARCQKVLRALFETPLLSQPVTVWSPR